MLTRLALSASVMLSLACPARVVVLPDPGIPHRVAEETKVKVWVRAADGTLTMQTIELDEGWYCASPEVVGK